MRICRFILAFAAIFSTFGCGLPQQNDGQQQSNETSNMSNTPIIIAHRGLSGEWPEHSLEAYRAAIEAGADYIEPDLVLTKDGVLVIRHENDISETTNVADHPEFADRKAARIIDGHEFNGWFTEDFTLAELKTLRVKERLPQLRNIQHDGKYQIATFREVLEFLTHVNKDRETPIGIYPETKHPSYFENIGLPHEGPMLKLIEEFGYVGRDAAIFLQSFEVGNLKALRKKTDVRLIQLMKPNASPADNLDTTYEDMATPQGLMAIAEYADGVGPAKDMVIPRNMLGQLQAPSSFVADAHAAGLKVHPWTFRRENYFLPLDYKSGVDPRDAGDLGKEVKIFIAAGIDGIFTDNTPEVAAALKTE